MAPDKDLHDSFENPEGSEASLTTKVIFGNITIYELPMRIGDNPAVSSGAPIRLGGKPVSVWTTDLDSYEAVQVGRRRKKRDELIISARSRAKRLMSAGYTLEDVARAALEAEEIKQQRVETLEKMGWENFTNFLTKTARTPLDLVTGAAKTTGVALKTAEKIPVLGPAGKVLVTGVNSAGKAMGAGAMAVVTGVGSVPGGILRRMSRASTPSQNTVRATSA